MERSVIALVVRGGNYYYSGFDIPRPSVHGEITKIRNTPTYASFVETYKAEPQFISFQYKACTVDIWALVGTDPVLGNWFCPMPRVRNTPTSFCAYISGIRVIFSQYYLDVDSKLVTLLSEKPTKGLTGWYVYVEIFAGTFKRIGCISSNGKLDPVRIMYYGYDLIHTDKDHLGRTLGRRIEQQTEAIEHFERVRVKGCTVLPRASKRSIL